MVAMFDQMASKYGMLPSEVLDRATTFDAQVHLNSETYINREKRRAQGDDISETYSQAEAEFILRRSR
jgi:hypothetical protein